MSPSSTRSHRTQQPRELPGVALVLTTILTLCLLLVASVVITVPAAAAPAPDRGPDGVGPGEHGGAGGGLLIRGALHFLQLNEEQRVAVVALIEEAQADAAPLREEQRMLRQELRDLLAADDPDATAVGTSVLAIRDLGDELTAIHQDFEASLRALLTDEQLLRLDAFRAARRFLTHLARRDGPGGPAADDGGEGVDALP